MSYQVLARKWRPQNFRQMVGQEHVLQALVHALESQRLHHAYLFTGTRGVGKTTIGRILAKCLSCEQGISPEPCGTCGACTAIVQGRYVDLIEIDAASRTKVEDMRELLDNVQYAPSQGQFKIYLIDEVHMLSSSSFNALLKTLEEPPEHVKFLFATTDPQKLPVTILSRCLQFNLKNMSPERIVQHLTHILGEENVGFEEPALWALARAADGSMRDALSLTDQAIAYGNEQLSEQGVSAMLGTVDHKQIYRILAALVARDAQGMLAEVASLAEFSPDYREVLASLVGLLHRIAVEQAVPGAIDNALGDQEEVRKYASSLSAEDVQLYYQIALTSRQDLSITPDPRAGLEMALLRMLAFQLQAPASTPELPQAAPGASSSIDTASAPLEASSAVSHVESVNVPEQKPVQSEAPAASLAVEQSIQESQHLSPPALQEDVPPLAAYDGEPEMHEAVEQSALEVKKKTPLTEHQPESESESRAQDVADVPAIVEESPVASSTSPDASNQWPILASSVPVTGMTLNLLLNMALEKQGSSLKLYVDSGHYRLLNESHRQRIEKALQERLGDGEMLTIEFIDGVLTGQETPMMWRERRRQEMQANARELIFADPHVQSLIEMFDARVVEESIEALGELH